MAVTLMSVIRAAFGVFEMLIIARVLMSWFNPNPHSPVVRFIADITDPLLGRIEKLMPQALLYPLNFTPIVALLLLSLMQRLIFSLLF